MISAFVWLDYSERERRKMLDVIDLFREHDTRHELGVGSVRDAFADMLFPGKRSAGRIKRTRTRSISYKETEGEGLNSKSNAIYSMVNNFSRRGVPINGVGLQMHVPNLDADVPAIAANIARPTALVRKYTLLN